MPRARSSAEKALSDDDHASARQARAARRAEIAQMRETLKRRLDGLARQLWLDRAREAATSDKRLRLDWSSPLPAQHYDFHKPGAETLLDGFWAMTFAEARPEVPKPG